jgi:hypothetical protein
MSDSRHESNKVCSDELRRLQWRSLVFGAVAVLFASSYAIRMALALPGYQADFMDLLKEQRLPTLTLFVLSWQRAFLGVAIATPILAGICAGLVRPLRVALWILAALLVVSLVEGHLLWEAILGPYGLLVSSLTGK